MSLAGTLATVSPIRSAALAQPDPRVSAMSCFSTPVACLICSAACFAISKGLLVIVSRGLVMDLSLAPRALAQLVLKLHQGSAGGNGVANGDLDLLDDALSWRGDGLFHLHSLKN